MYRWPVMSECPFSAISHLLPTSAVWNSCSWNDRETGEVPKRPQDSSSNATTCVELRVNTALAWKNFWIITVSIQGKCSNTVKDTHHACEQQGVSSTRRGRPYFLIKYLPIGKLKGFFPQQCKSIISAPDKAIGNATLFWSYQIFVHLICRFPFYFICWI